MSWENRIRREIEEEMIYKEYENVKDEYRKIIPIEKSVLNQYGGETSMFNTLSPKIKVIIEECLKNGQNSMPKEILLDKLGFFEDGIIEKYKLKAYINLMDKIIEKMGYKKGSFIYVFKLDID